LANIEKLVNVTVSFGNENKKNFVKKFEKIVYANEI